VTVKTLFKEATDGGTKDERRTAFQSLRYLSQYGQPEEAAEAKIALEHSGLYQEYGGELKTILSKLLARGSTQKTVAEETARLAELLKRL